ncbi:CHAP domain-containing protein [Actinosynnema sp. NPDC020468]|uniref:CHAP domain-containing protein n=1 Tax=Actinosynnema sp. NPDC020468 TaxID=3154488 RepID=UPI0033FF8ACE
MITIASRWGRAAVLIAAALGIAVLGANLAHDTALPTVHLVAAKKPDPADQALRDRIVAAAKAELKDKSHNSEKGATKNCNYYSGKAGRGTPCGNGMRAQEWCADFARYVWDEAGAKTSGVNSLAASFRGYGRGHHTWRKGTSLKGVKPGDVVGYRLDDGNPDNDHVGVVTEVDLEHGTFSAISGNSGAGGEQVSLLEDKRPGDVRVSGFAAPVPTKAEKPAKSGTGGKTAEPTPKKTATPTTPEAPIEIVLPEPEAPAFRGATEGETP